MKKIISILLMAVLCISMLASCENKEQPENPDDDNNQVVVNGLEAVAAMYKNSKPTKVVADNEQKFASMTLSGHYVLTTGKLEGTDRDIAKYVAEYNEMRNVDSGAGETIQKNTQNVYEEIQFKNGTMRQKKIIDGNVKAPGATFGGWQKTDKNLIPAVGGIAINLDKNVITEFTYENHELKFTVAAENVATVLGEEMKDVKVPVSVVITDDGAVVTGITIEYTLAANPVTNVAETKVTTKVVYTYDLEKVTF